MNKYIQTHKKWIDSTWEKLDRKLKVVAPRTKGILPYSTTNGKHEFWFYTDPVTKEQKIDYSWWTNGFWGGLLWLMYLDTKDEIYKECAIDQEELLDKAYERFNGLHHDVGFMWHLTSGANYRITGCEKSRVRALVASSLLFSRYNMKGGYIVPWNCKDKSAEHYGATIIDTMMNIHMLYWADTQYADDRFFQVANAHADMAMRDHVRPDGSVIHIVKHDENGEVIGTLGGQGYGVGSSWSRGQGWALYGFTLAYIHTGKQEYLDTAKRVAHYFISSICNDDYLVKVDFRAPDDPVIIDSTAAGLAACGLIEIARVVDEYEKRLYINAAINILKAVDKNCCNYDANEDGLVLRGTHSYHNEEQREISIVYGDFYYVEALFKLRGNDFLIW